MPGPFNWYPVPEQEAMGTNRLFPLNTINNFIVRISEHWHRLPRDTEFPTLEIIKSHLNMGLGTLIWLSLLERGLDKLEAGVPSNLSNIVIL